MCRRTVVPSSSTPQREGHVGDRVFKRHLGPQPCHTPSARVALNSPGSSSSSSSRGKKTGSAGGAHGVAAFSMQSCALPGWPNPAVLASAWLQLASTRRTVWSLICRLSCHIGHRAGVHHLPHGPRMEILLRLDTASSICANVAFGCRSPPLPELPRRTLGRSLPAWQDLLDLVLIHALDSVHQIAGAERHSTGSRKLSRLPRPEIVFPRCAFVCYRGAGLIQGGP